MGLEVLLTFRRYNGLLKLNIGFGDEKSLFRKTFMVYDKIMRDAII